MTKVQKFRCENKHEFYLPRKIPEKLTVVVDMLNNLSCPLCKSKKVNINPNVKEII